MGGPGVAPGYVSGDRSLCTNALLLGDPPHFAGSGERHYRLVTVNVLHGKEVPAVTAGKM